MRHRLLTPLLALSLLTASALLPTVAATATTPLILAVHPYLPAAEIQKRFAPLAEYLSRTLGQPVTVRVGQNYDKHIDAIGKDLVDIAFIGPAPYVKMLNKYGSKPLLARFETKGSPNLYGVIFTRRESPLQILKDLRGKRFAFGDPESTMSHIVPRALLIDAGVPVSALQEFKFLGSHHNVALAVLAGDFDAGAVKREVFDEFEAKGLRALTVTPATPDHLFITRSTLPAAEVQKLRAALLGLKDQPDGKEIMVALHKGLTALIPVQESDYEQLRAIVRQIETSH